MRGRILGGGKLGGRILGGGKLGGRILGGGKLGSRTVGGRMVSDNGKYKIRPGPSMSKMTGGSSLTNLLVYILRGLRQEADTPRNHWPLARISKTFPSCDRTVQKVEVCIQRQYPCTLCETNS